jgi:hypothetical protein
MSKTPEPLVRVVGSTRPTSEAPASVQWLYHAFGRSGGTPPALPAPSAACDPPDSPAGTTGRGRACEAGDRRHAARVRGGRHALVDTYPERRPEDG